MSAWIVVPGDLGSAVVLALTETAGRRRAVTFVGPGDNPQRLECARQLARHCGVGHDALPISVSCRSVNRVMIEVAVGADYAALAGFRSIWHPAFRSSPSVVPLFTAMATAVRIATGVALKAPLLSLSLVGVLRMGIALKAALERTWSCEGDKAFHCGSCAGCRERRKIYQQSQQKDTTSYELSS